MRTILLIVLLNISSLLLAQSGIDVVEASIEDLQQALEEGRITSVELVNQYLARIEAYDKHGPNLNSLIRINPRAVETAEALDRERASNGRRGMLHGIPVIVKDINKLQKKTKNSTRDQSCEYLVGQTVLIFAATKKDSQECNEQNQIHCCKHIHCQSSAVERVLM